MEIFKKNLKFIIEKKKMFKRKMQWGYQKSNNR